MLLYKTAFQLSCSVLVFQSLHCRTIKCASSKDSSCLSGAPEEILAVCAMQMYKLVIKKASAKVLQNHAKAQDANFLIQESDQIQKLVREYIRYAQKKLQT